MKLKLKAKIKKTSHLYEPPFYEDENGDGVEEAVGSFYTGDLQEDVEFNSAAEVYEFYKKNDWPKGWDDEFEKDYVNGGKWIKEDVELIDLNGPKPRNYEVTFRLVRDSEDDTWLYADEEILKIKEIV